MEFNISDMIIIIIYPSEIFDKSRSQSSGASIENKRLQSNRILTCIQKVRSAPLDFNNNKN